MDELPEPDIGSAPAHPSKAAEGNRFTAIGGINAPTGGNMTWPLVRLEATAAHIVLEPRLKLPGLVMTLMGSGRGPWILPRRQVVIVRPTVGQFARFNAGVEVLLDDRNVWIFWHWQPRRVLDALAGLGYPVRNSHL